MCFPFFFTDDTVYMPNEGELKEYIQSDVGKVRSNHKPTK